MHEGSVDDDARNVALLYDAVSGQKFPWFTAPVSAFCRARHERLQCNICSQGRWRMDGTPLSQRLHAPEMLKAETEMMARMTMSA